MHLSYVFHQGDRHDYEHKWHVKVFLKISHLNSSYTERRLNILCHSEWDFLRNAQIPTFLKAHVVIYVYNLQQKRYEWLLYVFGYTM